MIGAVVAVAPGTGRVARRADGLLFVSTMSGTVAWSPIIDAYLAAADADDAREAVTSAAVGAGFALDPFAMVSWRSGIELLVLGELTVHTDLPSVPRLSGAASATWVEHRVARPPERAQLTAGTPAEPDTRLDAGVVSAGGFAISIGRDASVRTLPAPARSMTPATAPAAQPPSSALDPLAILDAATGGDWMEESLDLDGARRTAAPLTSQADADDDPEITLSPPPPTPATPAATHDASTVVRARRCAAGHPNPSHAAQCRLCGELIGPSSVVETIPQPALGRLVLPDGSTVPVDDTLVVGRKPDASAARVDERAHLVALDAATDVSRTHVVVRAEGWMMTATDCDSRGRTVLRSPGADEPTVLEPWVAHEINPGDTLYLGGPTQLQVSGP